MGLDVSHDAFHGAYSAFNRLRQFVADCIGGSFPPHIGHPHLDNESWYWSVPLCRPIAEDLSFNKEKPPGLYIFLCHSDCDGSIGPEECTLVANDLEKVLEAARSHGGIPLGEGHIAAQGGYEKVLEKFIAGCRAAAEAGEKLEFY